MRIKICRCGKEFETNHSHKFYCTPSCQVKFSYEDAWKRIKNDYKYRCKRLLHSAKYRAKQIKVNFNLTTEYLISLWEEQNGCCAVSGRKFDLSKPDKGLCVKPNSPSLDRINSKKGYVEGNIRFVCYQVNTALNQYGEEALIALCQDIINFKSNIIA